MIKGGYVKAYRKMMEWKWWSDSDTVKVFLYILFRANLKDGAFNGEVIPRGSFVTSRKTIAHDCYISEQTTRTILNRLKSTNEITIRTTSKYTVITVLNYDEYQSTNQVTNQQLTNNQPTTNQQLTNNQPTTNQQLTTEEEWKNIKEWKNKDTEEPSAQGTTTKGKKKSSTLSYEEIDKVLTERNLAEGVKKMIHDWCEYKREKRQAYERMGLNSTIETMVELVGKYGEDEVNGAMRQCMSSNYDGLILEKFINQKGVNNNDIRGADTSSGGGTRANSEPAYGSYEWYRSVGWKED